MYRRNFLLSALPLLGVARATSPKIGLSRISILTDESANTEDEAIAFARQYSLKWVELRNVPGKGPPYFTMPEASLMAAAKKLKENQLGVSFLNTGMLKYGMPGTEPLRRNPEKPKDRTRRLARESARYEKRWDDLNQALRAAEILEVKIVRIFTFSRVADVPSVFPQISKELDAMAKHAWSKGIRLLIENEASQNVATSAELANILEITPNPGLGANWDPVNAMHREEAVPYPDGYNLLPKKRLFNVQMKAEALVLGPKILDWKAIFESLSKDDYNGKVGLETHVFDGTLLEKAHLCMKEIQRITA